MSETDRGNWVASVRAAASGVGPAAGAGGDLVDEEDEYNDTAFADGRAEAAAIQARISATRPGGSSRRPGQNGVAPSATR